MLLSIIVPAYNVEKYVERCIESLIDKENLEYEIIIVNDGSTDKTKLKLIELNKKYGEIIRVINQENKGLGGARNTGIKNAIGKYIVFIDSDDLIVEGLFSKIFNHINVDFDILTYKHIEFYNESDLNIENKNNFNYEVIDNIKAQKKFFLGEITSYAWDKIYKRSLFIENNILFSENTYYEDMRVVYELIAKANTVLFSDIIGYLYFQRSNSITKTFTNKHLEDFISEYNKLLNKIDKDIYYKCKDDIDIYKILKEVSIIRNIVSGNFKNYKIPENMDVKTNLLSIIFNNKLNINEKIIFIFKNNICFLKKIKSLKIKKNRFNR